MRPPSRQAQNTDGGDWDHSLLIADQGEDTAGAGPSYQTHPTAPPGASMSQKMSHHYSFPEQISSTARMGGGGMYVTTQPSQYAGSYGGGGYAPRDGRGEPLQYTYSQAQFPHDVHSNSPTSGSANHSPLQHARDSIPAQHSMQYAPRRTHPESHAFRALHPQHAAHLTNNLHHHDGIRMPPSPVPSDGGPPGRRGLQTYGGVDAQRLNTLS
ncbi:hypothetical protein HWV62_2187 [Athelia sp. TMB]|nr:hypothetical protein HWV62_2187 [Athelia sp. TMB]